MPRKNPSNVTAGSADWIKLADVLQRLASPPNEDLAWERLLRLLKTGAIPVRADVLEHTIWGYDSDVASGEEVSPTTWRDVTYVDVLDVGSGTVALRGTVPDDNRPWEIIIHGMAIKAASIEESLLRPSSPPT